MFNSANNDNREEVRQFMRAFIDHMMADENLAYIVEDPLTGRSYGPFTGSQVVNPKTPNAQVNDDQLELQCNPLEERVSTLETAIEKLSFELYKLKYEGDDDESKSD